MDVKQYNKILRSYNKQIETLIEEKKQFVLQNKDAVEKQIKDERVINKKWFIENFDIIWANKEKFMQDTPYGEIKIDFFSLYNNRKSTIDNIAVSDLIALWNLGFRYNGYPIVEYLFDEAIFKRKICYIKNNELIEEHVRYSSLSPIVMGILEYIVSHKEKIEDESNVEEYRTVADMRDLLAI